MLAGNAQLWVVPTFGQKALELLSLITLSKEALSELILRGDPLFSWFGVWILQETIRVWHLNICDAIPREILVHGVPSWGFVEWINQFVESLHFFNLIEKYWIRSLYKLMGKS